MAKRFINRLQTIDYLIKRKATGTPSELANRLEISESTLYEFLAVMKELGRPFIMINIVAAIVICMKGV